MGDIYDSKGSLVPGSSSLSQKAQEQSAAEKKRKVTAAWNARYFSHLKVGTGLGGAAAIDKYKTANPGWEKARDTWAQSMVRKPKPKTGSSLGELVK